MPPKSPERTVLLLHCPAGGGHRAAAEALAERAAERGLRAEVVDALLDAPGWFRTAYVSTHLRSSALVPGFYGCAYFASNYRARGPDELRRALDRMLGAHLVRRVLDAQPVAVVATHFYPLTVLSEAKRRGLLRAPLLAVVTDFAAHAVWADPFADAICCAAGPAEQDLARHGVERSRIATTGIPVRAAFGCAPLLEVGRDRSLHVLVTSGGFGVGPVLDVIRSFRSRPDMRLTVICGNNPTLAQHVRRACDQLGVQGEVLGFVRDMPQRMAAADIVVTKPGGLTVAEALAAGRPLLLVGAVPGQETLNQRWVLEQGAAVVAKPRQVGAAIENLWRHERLCDMAKVARRLGAADAADAVLATALRLAARATPRAA